MKIFKKWSNWEDIDLRTGCDGRDYLLQMRTREDGKREFKNRSMNATFFNYILFHGQQGFDKLKKILSL